MNFIALFRKRINEQNVWFLQHSVALFELSLSSKWILPASNMSIHFMEKFHGAEGQMYEAHTELFLQ